MKLEVYNISGETTGRSVDLSDEVFGVEPNEHIMYLAVKQHLARRRQGTHKAKERGEIKGSTRKIKRQKGTGTARAGSLKNPLFRSGGRVFGPRPRSYDFKLNKKVRKAARRSALSAKLASEGILLVEDFTFDTPKTKQLYTILQNLKTEHKCLLVTSDKDEKVYLSGRNIPSLEIRECRDLNIYDILKADKVVIAESAVEKIHELF